MAGIPATTAVSPVELTYTEVATLPAFLPYSLGYAVEVTDPAPLAATAVVSVSLPAGIMSEDAASQQLVRLFFYDEIAGQWQKLATERIQTGNNWILRASSSGPGVYAVALSTTNDYGDYAQPWQPVVGEAQVDLFTGSVQWSYPIAIPGGRNNLAPPLALSYNSGMVDNLSGYANPQPDGVAMGWSLGTNYIARKIDPETDGVPRYLEEYTLVLNGVSSKLVSLGGNQYALENERYWKIERIELTGEVDGRGNRGGDYWLVTLPDGIQYRFGYQDETAGDNSTESAWWMVTPEKDNPSLRLTNWRWNLDLISDQKENFVRLDYARETNDFIYGENIYDDDPFNNIAHIFSQNPWCEYRYECGACVIDGIFYQACYDHMSDRKNRSGYARGGYLEQITYSWPGADYKVVFNMVGRDDYEKSFDSQEPSYPHQLWQTFWSKQRLSSIDVYSVDQGQMVRRYELATSKINNILVLDSIQEVAADGSRMPPTSFNYY